MLNSLMRVPGVADRDWSGLKVLQIGGSPVAERTILRAREVLGDVLYCGYGLTETGLGTVMAPSEWFATVPGSRTLGSVGRPVPYVELEIRDEVGNRLAYGEQGEIWIRAPSQMLGYWNLAEETRPKLIAGWVLSGDIGLQDENGYVYILDRKEDTIVSGGFNIYPAELENVILELPGVVEVAVFAIPDERWGETPAVVCVIDPDAQQLTAEDVIAHCANRLGSMKKPRQVKFRSEQLPRKRHRQDPAQGAARASLGGTRSPRRCDLVERRRRHAAHHLRQ
jgi:acyl-CoA synthetase (AMP-forming)/AMP-acid ligase II